MNQNLSLADTMRPTSEDLKKLRGKTRRTQAQTAAILGVGLRQVQRWEAGEQSMPPATWRFYRCVATVCPRTSSSRKMAPPDLGISTATRYGTPLSKVISSTYSLSLAR